MSNKRKRKLSIICATLFCALAITAFAHSGRTDANGGHWNHATGEYHYHTGEYTGKSSSSAITPEQRERTKKAIAEMKKREEERQKEKPQSSDNANSNNKRRSAGNTPPDPTEFKYSSSQPETDSITVGQTIAFIIIGIFVSLISVYIIIFVHTVIVQLIKHKRKRK